ncbi:MAG: guanylate kinase, partial [Gemmatimonadetes bacterium]|nr:guanylate kinase [Gemmatimonadota bacterium]
MTPFLMILSSPSGAGKTTITKALLAARDDL